MSPSAFLVSLEVTMRSWGWSQPRTPGISVDLLADGRLRVQAYGAMPSGAFSPIPYSATGEDIEACLDSLAEACGFGEPKGTYR